MDLAAQPAGTAVCVVEWHDERPAVVRLETGCDDDALVSLSRGRRRIGLDVPLGWPEPFRVAIEGHARSEPWTLPAASTAERDEIALRRTDLDVRARTGHRPMSVAADSIGLVALRAASLCERLRSELGIEIDRSGVDGQVCEVYPGGLLRVWGEHPGGYGATSPRRVEAREEILRVLETRTGLEVGDEVRRLVLDATRSDGLDSILCAVLAGMVELGLTVGPPAALVDLARVEGWIHLPPAD